MGYHLADHIYLAQFREDLILLDTKKDTYTICSKEVQDTFERVLQGDNSPSNPLFALLEEGILQEKEGLYPFLIDRKVQSTGIAHVDWMLPTSLKKVPFSSHLVQAYLFLLKVDFTVQIRGFYKGIFLLRKAQKKSNKHRVASSIELEELASVLNQACLYYPKRIKCLEWAITFVLLGLKKGWRCNLEIGVQNYPFISHAWVECGGKVVMDLQELRHDLAIVLQEPFRLRNG